MPARIDARTDPKLYERVKAVAKAEDRSVSAVTRRALTEYCDRSEQDARWRRVHKGLGGMGMANL